MGKGRGVFFFKKPVGEDEGARPLGWAAFGEASPGRIFFIGMGGGAFLLLGLWGGWRFLGGAERDGPVPFVAGCQGPLRVRPTPLPSKPQRRIYADLSLKAPPPKRESLLPPMEKPELAPSPTPGLETMISQDFPVLDESHTPVVPSSSPQQTLASGKRDTGGSPPPSGKASKASNAKPKASVTQAPPSLDGLLKGVGQ